MRIKKFLPFLDGGAAVRGMTPAAPAARAATPTYQFTIVSVADTLNALRKQLYFELQALDLRVLNVRISRQEAGQLASTTVTLQCPPQLRGLLSAVALRLGQSPDVRRVHWENEDGARIAVLPA
ncbi:MULTISPECIES: hypothetical protein [Achromobacter]|uniref:hypothetical protein n=1 Tax=Achromobacter TaxID=222 RepID=UPI0003D60AE8|nr:MULTISPECIES: hypothetical protein [Achromobacter]AHC47287.1 hypothetical protein AX27061_2825 [Achromobacter xylosoxidans NBRC 15126 = ATCC 27061]KOQ19487.1 hypothetical protein ABW34_25795 [Achromobacter xylosoxidans]KOQ19953.1 hypothetical protein ABW35_24840 [Achromobacter xylosoxidans]KOQ22991.1 hypothetical protein ABW36_24965 [Achromobacter xylosoxidans]KOQ35901.1 hypothetical protein ABW37_28770 [Achromobacter xylosoxidans]